MNRLGHQSGAVVAALTVATATGMTTPQAAVFTTAALATSTLPDTWPTATIAEAVILTVAAVTSAMWPGD